jgi:hypothetical protein
MKSKPTRNASSRSGHRTFRRSKTALAAASCLAVASTAIAGDSYSRFVGLNDFSTFSKTQKDKGELVLLSPVIASPIDWNQLVVSWNTDVPTGTRLGVEVKPIFSDRSEARFFSMGTWSPDPKQSSSASKQKDSDGRAETDTLKLSRSASGAQIRLTFDGKDPRISMLKFLGLSFCNTNITPAEPTPNKAAWGKIIPTPELSQNSYPQEQGWCSATSMSMVLQRWAGLLHRPEMNLDVPEVAAGVLDTRFGTGNWSFNCAFAGKFADMRAYVTRFSDISELEDWVVAGIPVIISAPFHLLAPGRHDTGSGHLVVCIGFTETGDVVINDPATNLKKGQTVRHVYKRENVIRAWATSRNTVYLVYPVSAAIPENRLGQW